MREGESKLIHQGEGALELYDLDTDIAESNNLAEKQPEVTQRLLTALENWNKELIDPVFPGSSVKNEDWGPGGANQGQGKK